MRQTKWQQKKIAAGCCIICGKKRIKLGAGSSLYCTEHYDAHKRQQRNRYRAKHGIPLDQPTPAERNAVGKRHRASDRHQDERLGAGMARMVRRPF